jgi:hypothetical protein
MVLEDVGWRQHGQAPKVGKKPEKRELGLPGLLLFDIVLNYG